MRVALLLAAGRSRRFVGSNKLLVRHAGRRLLDYALQAARRAPVGRIVVVTGHDRARVADAARGRRIRVVHASAYRDGVSASLRAGLSALWPIEREIFVFLADMPMVPFSLPYRLARALVPGVSAVRAWGRGGPGHPVLLRRPDRASLDGLHGDRGLMQLIGGRTRWVPAGTARLNDVDTRHDLMRLERMR